MECRRICAKRAFARSFKLISIAACVLLWALSLVVTDRKWLPEGDLVALSTGGHGPTVDAPCGPVMGVYDDAHRVNIFYAIPYAMPPTEERRFMPPVRAKRWRSPRQAYEPGHFCLQISMFDPPKLQGSEDCLTADVYVPVAPSPGKKSYPVVVFIHGGDLSNLGSSFYPMEAAAGESKMVFVSLQYRLGAFGFMALREMAEKDPRGVSGNLGILDMQMGLAWVKDNIAAFGGNPHRVTLMGQSSGGTAVYGLLASPDSRGLFEQAIVMSGSSNLTMSVQEAYRQNEGFTRSVGCDTGADVVRCLQKAPADVILQKTKWDLSGEFDIVTDPRGRRSPGLLVADGVTVYSIETALETGMVDVPLIISSNEDEMDFSPANAVEPMPRKQFLSLMDARLRAWGAHFGSRTIEAFYRRELSVSPQWALNVFLTDLALTCGNDHLARLAAKGFKSPVYRVVVTQRPSKPIPTTLVPVPWFAMRYTFHNWDLFCGGNMWDWSPLFKIQPTKDDLALSQLLSTLWRNFTSAGEMEELQRISPTSRTMVTNLIGGKEGNPTAPTVLYPELNHKSEVCSYLDRNSMGRSFWWSD